MTPPTMAPRELRARILELREVGRVLTRAIAREHYRPELRLLVREWEAVQRGEVALLAELANRGAA